MHKIDPLSVLLSVVLAVGIILCFVLALSSCTPPDALPVANVHVVNSAWQVVREATVRALTSTDDIQADIEAYNAAHTDDQWRLIYGEVPPIEAAPTADAFIVTADTHEPTNTYLGIQRADLSERRATWRLQVDLDSASSGRPCVLYVDNVPPAPAPPPPPPDPWVLYAIYVVDASGAVLWEEHPEAGDYGARLRAWGYTVELHNLESPADPWSVVTGRLWP